jgi:hypothetical protein
VGVVGGFFGEGGEEFLGGGVVVLVEGFVGLSQEGVLFLLLGTGGVCGSSGELGAERGREGGDCEEEREKKY